MNAVPPWSPSHWCDGGGDDGVYDGGTMVCTMVVRGWYEGGTMVCTMVVRGWYEGGTMVVREWYEGGTRVVQGWCDAPPCCPLPRSRMLSESW